MYIIKPYSEQTGYIKKKNTFQVLVYIGTFLAYNPLISFYLSTEVKVKTF